MNSDLTKAVSRTETGVEQILFVCTGNICRSPMAEVLLRHALADSFPEVVVKSAGFLDHEFPASDKAVDEMKRRGLDLSAHRSTQIVSALESDPDLILVMASQHLRSATEIDRGLLDRTFTLKEFVRLAEREGPRRTGESIREYAQKLAAGRDLSTLIGTGRSEMDIEDPIGRSRARFQECASEIGECVRRLTGLVFQKTKGGHQPLE